MSELTNEEKENIEKKLEYLRLDLNNVPNFLKESTELDFRPVKNYKEGVYKVYKYVSIKELEIILTPTHRLDSIVEKYSKAASLVSYIEPDKEEDILKHITFLNMISKFSIEEIEDIDSLQSKMKEQIPFRVKYKLNYLWQIYYSEDVDKFFVLVPTEDLDYATFFYILKKKIEIEQSGIDEKIFVPINYLDYSREYLKKSEFDDLEKYLWFFTKEWPMIYEVYGKSGELTIQIVGETTIYEKIKSPYKIILKDKEEAIKFYKLIKALFILQTEFSHYYTFDVHISEKGGLEVFLNGKQIAYENLTEFIKLEVNQCRNKIHLLQEEKVALDEELLEYQQKNKIKERENNFKRKQIATYLECKKTFFGKVRYYFKVKKLEAEKLEEEINEKIEKMKDDVVLEDKEFYTVEDLLETTQKLDKILLNVKNLKLDINALKYKVEELEEKIKISDGYLDEIKKHQKNIFDFWKFSAKKELALEAGNNEESNLTIEKTFDYEEDSEKLGVNIDKIQRNTFSKEECDAYFIMSTEIIDIINSLRKHDGNVDIMLESSLKKLKEEAEKEKIFFNSEDFDIFGAVSEDKTKIKKLGNKKHREIERNKLQILDINKNTTIEEYKERLNEIIEIIEKSVKRAEKYNNISVYATYDKEINRCDYNVFSINPNNAVEEGEKFESINIYRINLKAKTPMIGFSNIIFFDNKNKTLPIGMGVSDKVLLDMSQLELVPKKPKLFRINQEIDELQVKTKIVCLYEYDVINLKNEK